jgi:LmbE family N-acetylglucosaminyl deacetylase
MPNKSVLAIAAHPDDIEFLMAGTLLGLRAAGFELHYLNVASGNCGSTTEGSVKVRRTRRAEAKVAARLLGARWHPSLVDDLEVFYNDQTLRRLASVVREVAPVVVLTHALEDYMEDHMNTARLAVTAAFARGMPNYRTRPPRTSVGGGVTIYHAMPHGLLDGMGRAVVPELFVDTTATLTTQREALAAHRSQKEWLDVSQGMDSYLVAMESMAREVGRMSGRFAFAEGWRRHSHLGFCAEDANPLVSALGAQCRMNAAYKRTLTR